MVGLSFGESFFQLLNDLIARFYTIVLSSGVQILIFPGRVADNLPLVIRGRQYRRRDRLGELLADHFPDDQPYDSGQRGLHRHRSA